MFLRDLVIFFSLFNIFLALLMFVKNINYNRNIFFLSFFLIFFTIQYLATLLVFLGGPVWLLAVLANNISPTNYLHPVLLFFYFRSTVYDNYRFRKTDLLHFIPFLINLVAVIPYWFTSFDYKYTLVQKLMNNIPTYLNCDFNLFYPQIINVIARPVQFTAYLFAYGVLLIKFHPKFKSFAGSGKVKHFDFASFLIVIFVMLSIFIIFSGVFSYQLIMNGYNSYQIQIIAETHKISAFLFPVIPLLFLFMPRLVYAFPQPDLLNKRVAATENHITEPFKKHQDISVERMQNTSLNTGSQGVINESFKMLSEAIAAYFVNEKPYLKHGFSVHDICQYLVAPRHHVQYCLNEVMGKKFTDLRNEYRIRYAIEQLESVHITTNSIEGIGRESGFSTNANFYISFRNITGMTPNQWLKNYRSHLSHN